MVGVWFLCPVGGAARAERRWICHCCHQRQLVNKLNQSHTHVHTHTHTHVHTRTRTQMQCCPLFHLPSPPSPGSATSTSLLTSTCTHRSRSRLHRLSAGSAPSSHENGWRASLPLNCSGSSRETTLSWTSMTSSRGCSIPRCDSHNIFN